MEPKTITPSTQKVRRDVVGGKRGDGDKRRARIRRPDARNMKVAGTDEELTGVAGLVGFGAFLRKLGVDRELRESFFRLKDGPMVVYPMETQIRLLVDAAVAGEERVFGLEGLAADPLFVRLAGGVIPSIDTVYRDLCRFDDRAIEALEASVARHGLAELRGKRLPIVHLDIDTTVEPLFGMQEGALPGPNPHYHARPSYHPVLARIAETGTFVGALLRPGNTGFGGAEVPLIEKWIDRVRAEVGPHCVIYVRIDGAADCIEIMAAITAKGAFFVTKADMTPDLCGIIATSHMWKTVDMDADGRPRQQVAEVPFARGVWGEHKLPLRVIAVRTRDRLNGRQIFLWSDLDYTVQVFITNDWTETPIDVARRYDFRAGIEPMIGEAKNGWGIGKVPSQCFHANHAMLLLKLLSFNLLKRYERSLHLGIARWNAAWIRRSLINVPGRIARSGRGITLYVPRRSPLARLLN